MIFGKHITRYYLKYLPMIALGVAALIAVDYVQLFIPELYETVVNGMKDGWVECHNNGNYNDFSYYIEKYGAGYNSTCGVWDSIERVAYKNGGGVKLDITKLEYDMLSGDGLDDWSDHPALDLEFTYTKTADFVENSDPLAVKQENKKESIFRKIYYFFKDLVMILSDWDALMNLLGINK